MSSVIDIFSLFTFWSRWLNQRYLHCLGVLKYYLDDLKNICFEISFHFFTPYYLIMYKNTRLRERGSDFIVRSRVFFLCFFPCFWLGTRGTWGSCWRKERKIFTNQLGSRINMGLRNQRVQLKINNNKKPWAK